MTSFPNRNNEDVHHRYDSSDADYCIQLMDLYIDGLRKSSALANCK